MQCIWDCLWHWWKGGMDEEEIIFSNAMDVEGVDFGNHIMDPVYHVNLAGMDDLRSYLDNLKAKSRHRDGNFLTEARFHNCPVSIYLPTDISQLIKRAVHMATLGVANRRAKILLFYFDDLDLKRRALEHFPHKIALRDVKSLVIDPFDQHGSHLARFKIKKGMVTIYLYAVKRKGKCFKRKNKFEELRSDINNIKNIDNQNLDTFRTIGKSIAIIVPVLFAVLSI